MGFIEFIFDEGFAVRKRSERRRCSTRVAEGLHGLRTMSK